MDFFLAKKPFTLFWNFVIKETFFKCYKNMEHLKKNKLNKLHVKCVKASTICTILELFTEILRPKTL